MQFFSIIFFLNDSKLYDEKRNELSWHPLQLNFEPVFSKIIYHASHQTSSGIVNEAKWAIFDGEKMRFTAIWK